MNLSSFFVCYFVICFLIWAMFIMIDFTNAKHCVCMTIALLMSLLIGGCMVLAARLTPELSNDKCCDCCKYKQEESIITESQFNDALEIIKNYKETK